MTNIRTAFTYHRHGAAAKKRIVSLPIQPSPKSEDNILPGKYLLSPASPPYRTHTHAHQRPWASDWRWRLHPTNGTTELITRTNFKNDGHDENAFPLILLVHYTFPLIPRTL